MEVRAIAILCFIKRAETDALTAEFLRRSNGRTSRVTLSRDAASFVLDHEIVVKEN